MSTTVTVLVGSLRADSVNRRLADALIDLVPDDVTVRFAENLEQIPFYNEDLDGESAPAAAVALRELVADSDRVLVVTPEYNRSIPGALKNALDVGSRPYGKSAWAGKPAAVVSVSPGLLGAFGANHHLRQPLVFLDMPVMQQPEAYVSKVGDLLGQDGKFINEDTKTFLKAFLAAFATWIGKTK